MARLPLVRDRYGEIVDRRALREERGGARASAGRSILPSQPSRIPTPERLAATLRRAETPGAGASVAYLEIAELMEERHIHYIGVLGTRRRAVSQIGVAIEPATDSAEDVRDADLVRSVFAREEFGDEAFDILDAVGKGYSVTEIIWDMSERQWMPARLQHQLPQWYDYDPDTGTRLMRREADGYVEMEPYKYIVHAAPAKSGLPGRSGLARCAAWAWMLGCYTLHDWMRFCEIYGQPLRIGRYHPAASDKDRRTLYRAVRDIATDAAAILPEGMTIDFEGGGAVAAHSEIYSDLLAYLDARISIAVLGQTLTTESGGTGSYALGRVHDLVRHDIERDDGRRLAATLRRDLVVPMVTLNHGPRPAYPRVTIAREDALDVDLMSKSLARLVPLGLRVRADEVRARLRLAPPDDDDEVLTAPAAPAAPPGATDPPEPAPARARDAGADLDHRALARTLDEGDPLPALTARARATLGPLVDAWAGRVRDALAAADSLATVRTALDAAAADPETAAFAAALAAALLAAHLAGRYDVAEEAGGVALATAAVQHTQLPFDEQIRFFRSKLNLPTQAWTDLWESQHDVSFVVAGAARDDLLTDLRDAVDRAIADGTTLATFRQDFDAIVARHGWSYNGGRDWRTRVIYGTNLRTSYAAGRYRQMQDVAEHRPWWRYRHSDASEQPRHDHLAWDGLVLRHDDPWWDTHYPPNGWGCKCYLETLAARDMRRLGRDGPDTAPAVRTRTVTVGAKGPTPRTVTVPVGIDPGWAYAPGQRSALGAAVRHRLDRAASQAPAIASAGVAATLAAPRTLQALADEWRRWWREGVEGTGRRAEAMVVGALPPAALRALAAQGVTPASAAVSVTRGALGHLGRGSKVRRGQALAEADVDRLPEVLAAPEATLYEPPRAPGARGTLVMVFTPAGAEERRRGKWVIEIDARVDERRGRGRRRPYQTNSIRTAGYVQAGDLRDPRYVLLDGEVGE